LQLVMVFLEICGFQKRSVAFVLGVHNGQPFSSIPCRELYVS
jgi:hypothetical protein